jgi:endonuclease G
MLGSGEQPVQATTPGASISVHTSMGLPDNSTPDVNSPNAYLSVKPEYVLSYNSANKTANWVSWELNASYLGSTPRQGDFRPDDTLPASFPQATDADYTGSGYNRGHMCASEHRTSSVPVNQSTFYFSNMIPQANNNDAGPWAKLEADMKAWAQAGKEIFVTAGGVYGVGSSTIGNGVGVPSSTYEVVVVLDAPGEGVQNVTTSTRVIGILMPNNNSSVNLTDAWQSYRVSLQSIEQQTGLAFLSDVAPAIRNVLETEVDSQ